MTDDACRSLNAEPGRLYLGETKGKDVMIFGLFVKVFRNFKSMVEKEIELERILGGRSGSACDAIFTLWQERDKARGEAASMRDERDTARQQLEISEERRTCEVKGLEDSCARWRKSASAAYDERDAERGKLEALEAVSDLIKSGKPYWPGAHVQELKTEIRVLKNGNAIKENECADLHRWGAGLEKKVLELKEERRQQEILRGHLVVARAESAVLKGDHVVARAAPDPWTSGVVEKPMLARLAELEVAVKIAQKAITANVSYNKARHDEHDDTRFNHSKRQAAIEVWAEKLSKWMAVPFKAEK